MRQIYCFPNFQRQKESRMTAKPPGSNSDLAETLISSKSVYRGKLLEVREDLVRLPNGHTARREWVVHPGAVMILPLLSSGDLVLERQYRYPLGRDFIEFPAGKIDSGEDPLVTGRRELLEETGYTAERWLHLATVHPVIGYSNERIEIYLAEDLTRSERNLDEGEFIEVFTASMTQAARWVEEGVITDVKTVTGIFWMERVLARRARTAGTAWTGVSS
jgi:ADP-ribose pyrophosphatase